MDEVDSTQCGTLRCREREPSTPSMALQWQLMKRLERGRFVWPAATEGRIALSAAQLAMLLEGIDWRTPQRTWQPLAAG